MVDAKQILERPVLRRSGCSAVFREDDGGGQSRAKGWKGL